MAYIRLLCYFSLIAETKYLTSKAKRVKITQLTVYRGFASYSSGPKAGWLMAEGQLFIAAEDMKGNERE